MRNVVRLAAGSDWRAEELRLPVFNKPDSQEICFVPDNDYARLVKKKAPEAVRPGEFVSPAGEVLGAHEGHQHFTIGQRKGLRIGRPADDGQPRYVLDIEPVTGTVTVGPREALTIDRIEGIRPRWCGSAPTTVDGTVQLRAHGDEHRAVVRVAGDSVSIELRDPAQGIAPGQAAVIYEGTRVVGSCTIAATSRA